MPLQLGLLALWKFCVSLRKRDWALSDYPVVVTEQSVDASRQNSRIRTPRYKAFIVNWGLVGTGDTRKEARDDLAKNFEAAKAVRQKEGEPLPRPGVRVPIEFASQKRVYAHPALAEDFIRRVLELDWTWISDDSTLWDFHRDETNNVLIARIKAVYAVDVSDITSAKLYEILDRIAEARSADC